MIRSYENQTAEKGNEREKEKDRVSAERREVRGSWRQHRRECMQHGNPEGEQFYLFHQEHIPSSPLSISNSIFGSPSYYPLLDSVHLVIYTWCIRIPFYALRAPSKRERLVTVCVLLIAFFFFYENRSVFIALQIPFKNNSSLGHKCKNNEWSMPNSVMVSTQSYSHLHLLVKRSRRNNRDSLAATEIPRRLFSFSLSFSPSSLPLFSLFIPRALCHLALFHAEPRSRHAYEWNCFAASRKNVTLLNDSRLFIAAVNQHHPRATTPAVKLRETIIRSSFQAFPLGPLYARDIVSKSGTRILSPFSPMLVHQNKSAVLPT